MNLKKTSACVGLIAGSVLAFSNAPARAASFTASDATSCVGQSTCTVNDFFTLKATKDDGTTPLQISQKSESSVVGVGVAKDAKNLNWQDTENGDPSGGEIDLGELLSVAFAKATQVAAIDLSYLYQPGVYSDEVYEIALATPFASSLAGSLTVKGDNTATWTFDGIASTAVNLSPSVEGSGGSYSILNPFGNMEISGFTLKPKSNGTATSFHNSDFALSRVETVETVPEPGTITALLGLGAFAGLGLRRRSQSNLSKV